LFKHFRIFRSKFYIKRDDENLGKFDSREDEGIFLGNSSRRKSYICYKKILQNIVESINVKIDEEIPHKNQLEVEEIDCSEEEEQEYGEQEQENEEGGEEEIEHQYIQTPMRSVQKNHPKNLILCDKNAKTQTRRKLASNYEHMNFSLLSKIDPMCFS
jgi:hypothetical protein